MNNSQSFFVRILLGALLLVAASSANAQVTVSDPWVRATVPGQRATGAFMKIQVDKALSLVAAKADLTAATEVHEMSMTDGIMRMRQVTEIPIQPGEPLELKPGGFHIMIMGLDAPVKAGQAVSLTLTFKGPGGETMSVEVDAPVLPLTTRSAKDHQAQHGHHGAHKSHK